MPTRRWTHLPRVPLTHTGQASAADRGQGAGPHREGSMHWSVCSLKTVY